MRRPLTLLIWGPTLLWGAKGFQAPSTPWRAQALTVLWKPWPSQFPLLWRPSPADTSGHPDPRFPTRGPGCCDITPTIPWRPSRPWGQVPVSLVPLPPLCDSSTQFEATGPPQVLPMQHCIHPTLNPVSLRLIEQTAMLIKGVNANSSEHDRQYL